MPYNFVADSFHTGVTAADDRPYNIKQGFLMAA